MDRMLLLKEIEAEIEKETGSNYLSFNRLEAMQKIEAEHKETPKPCTVVESVTVESDEVTLVTKPVAGDSDILPLLKGYGKARKEMAIKLVKWMVEERPTSFNNIRAVAEKLWPSFEDGEPTYFALQNFTSGLLKKISPLITWDGKAKSPIIWN